MLLGQFNADRFNLESHLLRNGIDAEHQDEPRLSSKFDVIVVQAAEGHLSLVSYIKHLRDNGVQAPVLVLIDTYDLSLVVSGLKAGADDVVVASINPSELVCRLRALRRRADLVRHPKTDIGDITIDESSASIIGPLGNIALSRKEYDLLEHLSRNQGKVVTRTSIMNSLYGYTDVPHEKIIDVFVCKLRRKLNSASSTPRIQSVRGLGYMLSVSPSPG